MRAIIGWEVGLLFDGEGRSVSIWEEANHSFLQKGYSSRTKATQLDLTTMEQCCRHNGKDPKTHWSCNLFSI